ncbi:hypothetical protein QE152_g5548 [Popillia japonica]|uniref:Uncharacterized protein n=1 Tax=Popillia japonica TaxID=7064 RepID=A0AAW1MLQ3_POPJA
MAQNLEVPIYIGVQSLKTIRVSSLTLEEKQKIQSAGRPKPITHLTKYKIPDYKRTFKIDTGSRLVMLL